jgi:hypothetical protein
MTDNEVLECLERAIRDQKALAAVLAEGNHASVHLIEAASKLETLVTMQLISKDEATETLKQLHKMGGPADQAIDRLTADKYASNQAKLGVSLLVQSGAINARLAERSVHALVAAGLVDQQLLGSAMACAYFIESGSLKLEHAVIALQYCQRTRGGLEDAIRDLKMTDMLAAPSKKQMVTHKMQKPVFNSEGLPMVFEPRPEGPNQKQRLLTTAILSVICLALALGTFAVPGALPAGVAREGSRYAMIALIIGLIFVIAQQWRAKAEPANDDHLRLRVRSGRTSENPRL